MKLMYSCIGTSIHEIEMIQFKRSGKMDVRASTSEVNLMESVYPIYLELRKQYPTEKLLILESMNVKSEASRVSIIGVNPVLNISVIDLNVTITANQEIQKKVKILYSNEPYIELGVDATCFQLKKRVDIWSFLRRLDEQFKLVDGGVMAFTVFSYNTIHYIEDIEKYEAGDIPDIQLICYSNVIEFSENSVNHYEYGFNGVSPIDLSFIEGERKPSISVIPDFDGNFSLQSETSKSSYLLKAKIAIEHVRVGDVYQIQIGHKIGVSAEVEPLEVYARLRVMNPSPYMYFFDSGKYKVIGASPESFIYMDNEIVTIRPIAGTLGKSSYATKDDAQREFQANAKEIAEHLMLVDLCRNDLSRVSDPNTLKVNELMSVEEYSHVYHLISTVNASITNDVDKFDVIQAAFPAGTMTGTPKIRAIELISDLEDSSRGLYAGSLGMMTLGGNYINTALCIRTAIERNGVYSLRASAGIVSDSKIESEYLETLHKMASVFKAITNKEITCHIA
jgi:anthranilate synthase component 1